MSGSFHLLPTLRVNIPLLRQNMSMRYFRSPEAFSSVSASSLLHLTVLLNLHLPLCRVFVPDCLEDLGIELHMLTLTVLFCHALEICDVKLEPVMVRLEREDVYYICIVLESGVCTHKKGCHCEVP